MNDFVCKNINEDGTCNLFYENQHSTIIEYTELFIKLYVNEMNFPSTYETRTAFTKVRMVLANQIVLYLSSATKKELEYLKCKGMEALLNEYTDANVDIDALLEKLDSK